MKRWFWSLVLTSAFSDAFAQELLYINVDPLCMDRYEYHINGESKGVEYIAYRVRQSQKDNVFLEVGSESSSMQLSMPESKDCRNVRFSPDYIDKINTGEVQVFIVRKADIGYNISQVNLASYQYADGNTLKYKSYGLDFFCNLDHSSPGVNLAQEESSSEIYYGGEAMNGCNKEYHFRKMPRETCKPNVDIDYVPEIGVIRELTRVSQMNDHESTLNLVRINDVSLETYMNKLCQGKSASVYMPTSYAVETTDLSNLPVTEVVIDGQTFGTDGNLVESSSSASDIASVDSNIPTEYNMKSVVLTSKGAASSTVKEIKPKAKIVEQPKVVAPEGQHIVLKGETLYGISRRYNLTVDQLKLWNNLKSEIIADGSFLKIKAPVSKALVAKPSISMKKTPALAPKSYEETSVKFTSKGGDVVKVPESKTISTVTVEKVQHHTVAPGETISGLAREFGYTEQRFRSMNNLEKTDILTVGQVVKITDCVCPIPENYKPGTLKVETPKSYDFVAKGPAPANKKEENTETPKAIYKRMTVHIVQEDETIADIASKYKISVKDLIAINGFEEREVLIPNQRLFVD